MQVMNQSNRCPLCRGRLAQVVGANDYCLDCGKEFLPIAGGLVAAQPQRLASDSQSDAAVKAEFMAVVGREERAS